METINADYWKNRKIRFLTAEYWKTRNHPHRKQIINILRKLQPWNSLLEIGCGCGMNLYNIRKEFGSVKLSGLDASREALDFARKKLSDIQFVVGDVEGTVFFNEEVVLFDAVLMYVSSQDIYRILENYVKITQKAIILCEWYDKDKLGKIVDGHWSRNYPDLFKDFGWKCRMKKVIWPESEQWQKRGRIFIATK